MTKAKKEDQAPQAPDSAHDIMAIITTDEHAGRGGSYVLDPSTGRREKVETETETKE